MSALGSRIGWLFWIGLWGAGCYLMQQMHQRAVASNSWPVAACVITSSGISSHVEDHGSKHGNRTVTYSANVSYRFVADGKTYSNSRIRYGFLDASLGGARALAARFPAGKTVPVRYNPQDPTMATLIPGDSQMDVVFIWVAAAMALLGVIGFVRGWRWGRRSRF